MSYKNLWFWGYLLNSFGSEGSELSSLCGPGTQTNPVLYFSDLFSDSSPAVTVLLPVSSEVKLFLSNYETTGGKIGGKSTWGT